MPGGSLEIVGPIAIRRQVRRLRRHAAGLLLVIAVAGAVVAHHSDFAPDGLHHDMALSAVELCVGAFTAVGAAVAAVSLGSIALGRWPTPAPLAPTARIALHGGGPTPLARAGPSLLPLVCVWRR